MGEQYNAILRYDVLAACRTPFRTGNRTELCRDGDGVPFVQGTGIRGALRKWAGEHLDPLVTDRFFDGGELILSDGVFLPGTQVNLRSCTGIDRERGIARNGGYFQMEVLPAGSQFRFCVIWRGMWKDVSEAARLTETLLSALHRGEAVLGNRSALGFGRVRLQVKKRCYNLSQREDREDWLAAAACWPEGADERSLPLELETRSLSKSVVFRVNGRMDRILVGGSWGSFPFEERGRTVIPATSIRGAVKRQSEGVLRSLGIRDGALIDRMFGREGRGQSSVICTDAQLEAAARREQGRILVDRASGVFIGKKTTTAAGGTVCMELLAPNDGEICGLLLLTLRDLALGMYGLGSGVNVGLGSIKDTVITAEVPEEGILSLSFDRAGNSTLDDPDGIARTWMEKWREYCGQACHGT